MESPSNHNKPTGDGLKVKTMSKSFNKVETEVIFLNAIYGMINSMVNNYNITLSRSDSHDSVILNSDEHKQLFMIMLVDFLSKTDKESLVPQTTYLEALRQIAQNPSFTPSNSLQDLAKLSIEFSEWLNASIDVKVWLEPIEFDGEITLQTLQYIKLCGDLSKHNLLRSGRAATDLENIFKSKGRDISRSEALLSLEYFNVWLRSDALNSYVGLISEYLNNIRWSIYEYMRPEFRRSCSLKNGEPQLCPPDEIADIFPLECYYDIMNKVANPPYLCRFKVSRRFLSW